MSFKTYLNEANISESLRAINDVINAALDDLEGINTDTDIIIDFTTKNGGSYSWSAQGKDKAKQLKAILKNKEFDYVINKSSGEEEENISFNSIKDISWDIN